MIRLSSPPGAGSSSLTGAHDLRVTELVGNDGQCAYYMAADPVHGPDYVDDRSYRPGRFFYP
jgi:hypothetical protein